MIRIAQNIKTIRKGYRLSQTEFAAKIGVCRSSIWTYESGKNTPSYETMIALSKLCGVSIHDIIINEVEQI